MTKYKKTSFITSFQNAFHGVKLLWKSEKNFRVHTTLAIIVLLLGLVLGFDVKELCILVLTITFVLLSEIFNSAIEFTLDAVYKNKYSKLVGMAKDIAAAGVTFSAIISVIVGLLVFGHHFFD